MTFLQSLRKILLGAAAGFVQGETLPNASVKNSGIFAGVSALATLLDNLQEHPAVITGKDISVVAKNNNPPVA